MAAGSPPPASALRPAVFFDRDGTLIENVSYLVDPAHVRLMPGAIEVLRKLRAAGFVCVVVTNQSGIGRGLLTEADLAAIHDELDRQLSAAGVAVDAYYHCSSVPHGDDPTVVEYLDRKPGPGMLLRAARTLGLDLSASWMVGDLISDVLAGINAGCRASILISRDAEGPRVESRPGVEYDKVDDIGAAVELILEAQQVSRERRP
jgi:D-glycero-D-manno-heptose 1,7-bisphosphate phosphatase